MIEVDYIDHMGNDKRVANVARVSFDKWDNNETLSERDTNLISYLATHGHWSPFAHSQLCVRVSAPIVVTRQLFKHQVGLVANEISRRYVDVPPEFYLPDAWRGKPVNKKQGSSDVVMTHYWARSDTVDGEAYTSQSIDDEVKNIYQWAGDLYDELIQSGVCPEQARLILPQGMITSWIWTGSLVAFMRVCNLRLAKDAQKETRDVVADISKIVQDKWPVSYAALINKEITNEQSSS